MRVGVIGCGTVGSAVAKSFTEHCPVLMYDVDKRKSTHSREEVLSADVVHVCVPEAELEELARSLMKSHAKLAIRSTTPIGTTRRLAEQYGLTNLAHSPEFLTSRCAFEDACNPTRCIIGAPNGEENQCTYNLSALYSNRFPNAKLFRCTSDESELAKLAVNSFFAVKIGFFNEINAYAEKTGLDWSLVLSMMLADNRINPSHTKVPGPDGMYGYGGSCLPKDVDMLSRCIKGFGTGRYILEATQASNKLMRKRRTK